MREWSLIDRINKGRFSTGPEVVERPPERGIKRFFFLLTTHFWRLVSLNMLFLLFSIPVVTIPAALCGMNRVLIELVREGNCCMWSDFIGEFKQSLFKSLPFGLIYATFLFYSYYALSWSISISEGLDLILAAVGIFLFITGVAFSSYAFVFLPTIAIKNKYIARNAFIIMLTEWKTSLVIIGSVFIAFFVSILFFPYSIIFLTFIGFSLLHLAICTAANDPLQKRIIGPYEKQQRERAM